MSEVVIKVENLSKQYRIGAKDAYKTFRETLIDSAKAPFARLYKAKGKEHRAKRLSGDSSLSAQRSMRSSQGGDLIWALKDVSFEVNRGEVVGIIGRNGAGKSTLLKILSKITEPTTGRVELRGRVGSLLEVGTGFHPELTGHENVYLYGAILGMDRWEITRKFDEIVAFAELERFVDTPVKRYSSGMYMRLAFAVAAHLEPEILLVDEVLAVGDAAFQKKCLGKMGEVSKEGRTVLFVSHNIAVIVSLCKRSLLIHNGSLREDGPSEDIVSSYIAHLGTQSITDVAKRKDRKGNGRLKFTDIWIEDKAGNRIECITTGQDVRFVLSFQSDGNSQPKEAVFSISVLSSIGQSLLLFRSNYTGERFEEIPPSGHAVCIIPHFPLTPGDYHLSIYSESQGEVLDWVSFASVLKVHEGDYFGTGRLPPRTHSPFLAEHLWTISDAS